MSLVQRFFARFSPRTTVSVDAGELVFRNGTVQSRSEPLIRFAENGKITDIGSAAATAKGGRLVQLFTPEDGSVDQAIRAFCRFHLAMTSGANPLRSRVTIVEPGFRKTFGRHAATALQRSLRADGFQTDIAEGDFAVSS